MVRSLASQLPRPTWRLTILHALIRPFARTALSTAAVLTRVRSGQAGIDRLDAVLVINLRSRSDRLTDFEAEMRRLGITARRVDAIRDDLATRGVARSHSACLRMMIDNGWAAMLVCEDDAVFRVSRRSLDVITEAFLDDAKAEVACLAFNLRAMPLPHNLFFFRARNTQTTACYLVKRSIAGDLIALCERSAIELGNGGDRLRFSLDMIWKPLQRTRVFLVPTVRAVVQADGFSDVEGRFVSYGV